MNDLNHVVLIGRLTRDAEIRYTQGGMAITGFSIAVNRRIKKGDQWQDEANFFDCTLFGKSAESMTKYLTKGQQIAVDGELKQDRWEKNGEKHTRIQIVCNSVQLLGGKRDSQQSNDQPPSSVSEMGDNSPHYTQSFEDDIPF